MSDPRPRQDIELPDDACPRCGTMMEDRHGELTYPVNGQKVPVQDASHLLCPACGEVVLRSEDVRWLRQEAFARYRREQGLLEAEEIRAIREGFGMSQSTFAALLRLGANTISRWEAGRKVQTAALDVLLRLIRDQPGNLEYLRRNAA